MSKGKSTKEMIVQAMYTLVAREGYADTSIQLIADEIGIAKSTIYSHFDSKEQIFIAVQQYIDESLNEKYIKGIESSNTIDEFKDSLLSYGYSLVGSFKSDKQRRLVMSEIILQATRNKVFAEYQNEKTFSLLYVFRQFVEHGITLGYLNDDTNIEEKAYEMHVVLIGISQAVLLEGYAYGKDFWKRYVESLFMEP